MNEAAKRWTKIAEKLLLNRTIKKVFYMSEKTAVESGWDNRGIVLKLDDGSFVQPCSDDELNNVGTLYFTKQDEVLPVL